MRFYAKDNMIPEGYNGIILADCEKALDSLSE